jgi:hypothetical protein
MERERMGRASGNRLSILNIIWEQKKTNLNAQFVWSVCVKSDFLHSKYSTQENDCQQDMFFGRLIVNNHI